MFVKGPPISPRRVFERDGWVCQLCHEAINQSLKWPDSGSPSMDHIIPLKFGGKHVLSNLQAAHLGCNSKKQASMRKSNFNQYGIFEAAS